MKDGKKEKVIKEIEYIHNFTMYFIEYIMTHGGEKKLKDKPNVKENKEQNGKKKRKKKIAGRPFTCWKKLSNTQIAELESMKLLVLVGK